jgi:hypothetical protein
MPGRGSRVRPPRQCRQETSGHRATGRVAILQVAVDAKRRCHTLRVTRRIRDRLRRRERGPEWPLMSTVPWQDKAAQVLSLRRSRWQDKAQVVSLRRSRLERAAVEVAVVFRPRTAGTSTVA